MNGLTRRLLHAVPKPWLFGLYGALGGLIGSLFFGEGLWRALRPSAPVAATVPPLRLAATPALEVYQGGTNKFGIKIARDGWSGPVTLKADRPPEGVRIDRVTIPADRGEADVEVRVMADAATGSNELALEAEGPPVAGTPSAAATIRLTVRKMQPSSPALRLSVSPEVVVDQPGKNRFGVIIARDHFRGPVHVELGGLPEGVTAGTLALPDEVTKGEIEVEAGKDATVGTTTVSVTATGPDPAPAAGGSPTGSSRLSVRVSARKDLPEGLRLGVSPAVVVHQTGKNRFGVVIARDHFRGPVAIALDGLPSGVKATALTLPADAVRGEIEIEAARDAQVGTRVVSVTATGPGGLPGATAPPKAFSRLDVTVNPYKPSNLKVDVMFVLDVTGSMQWAIDGVRDGIIVFADELGRLQMDVRVGLTGFRDHLQILPDVPGKKASPAAAPKKEAPRLARRKRRAGPGLFPEMPGMFGMGATRPVDRAPRLLLVGGEIFTKDYRAFGKEVGASLVADGGGAEPESSLDALALAARQSYRDDASRVLILITDAPPNIPDLEIQSLDEAVAMLRRSEIDQLHLVIPDPLGRIYTQLQVAAPGGVFSLRDAAQGKGAFAALLPTVSREIARMTAASQPEPLPEESPPLSAPPLAVAAAPLDPSSSLTPPPLPPAKAAGDLPPVPAPAVLKGVQSQESFAAESTGRLLLAIGLWTAMITAMIALALCAGQHHYLRQSWLPPGAALRGWLGGLVAGLAGGAAGQLLYQAAPGAPAGEALFRILGWTLLGSLAGWVLAFFVPNLRSDRGLLGGAMGGAAGALGFLGTAMAVQGLPGGEAAGRVLGAVLLGLALGLMLALAERMARKAWLEVGYGGGEFRTVNLGVEPVSIGSNARAATIYARGAAPVAYRYWFLEGKVKQEDVATGTVTELRPGEPQSVGAVTLTIHTAASASATAPRVVPASRPAQSSAPVAKPPPHVRPTAPAPAPAPAPPVPPPIVSPTPPAALVASSAPSTPGIPARQDPGCCPGCGRRVPGGPGKGYCMSCDIYI